MVQCQGYALGVEHINKKMREYQMERFLCHIKCQPVAPAPDSHSPRTLALARIIPGMLAKSSPPA
jgi:hypothetical protein